jgi:hypothetical protein
MRPTRSNRMAGAQQPRRGRAVVAGGSAALGLLLGGAACAGAHADDRAATGDVPLVMQVDDPHAEADMATLSDASTTVVRGTVAAAETGVRFGMEDGGNQLRYTQFTVDVDDVLAGHAGNQVRVVLSTHLGRRQVAIEGRPVPRMGDEGVWFLTPMAPEFGVDGYVLTGQAGLLLLDGDEVIGGGPPDAPVRAEVERLGSAEAVVAHVRTVAGARR